MSILEKFLTLIQHDNLPPWKVGHIHILSLLLHHCQWAPPLGRLSHMSSQQTFILMGTHGLQDLTLSNFAHPLFIETYPSQGSTTQTTSSKESPYVGIPGM